MVALNVVTIENKKAGSVELDPAVFDVPLRPDLLHAEVRRQLADRRRGTHSTKNRAAVSGGGSKPWRQKGTGRARQGTSRAPQWAGGGSVFGPVPRDYAHSLPKKVRRAALRGALSQRHREAAITVVDDLALDAYRTRRIREILKSLELDETGVLIVVDKRNDFVERSARNLPSVKVIRAEGLNVYDVLRFQKLLVTKAALAVLGKRLGDRAGEEAAQ